MIGSKELLSVFLFASSIFFLNAPAQACTPTVWLFRHAEDTPRSNPPKPPSLTNSGLRHAAQYPQMLLQYESVFSTCPVKRVLAMYNINPPAPWGDGNPGTSNPLNTAQPLANQCCGGVVQMKLVTSPPTIDFPLYEKIYYSPQNNGLGPANGPGSPSRLFLALQGTLNSDGSVAIFYTQDGMVDVSFAFGVPPVGNPDPDADNDTKALSWPGILRNSANEFTWTGTNYVKQYPTPPPTQRIQVKPVQCFTFNKTTRQLDFSRYYCQSSGSLDNGVDDKQVPAIPANVANQINGKLCVFLSPISGIRDTYGYCL